MRTLSPALIRSKNELTSTKPWAYLYEVEIEGAPGPYRLTDYQEAITFQTLSFLPAPVELDAITENSKGEIHQMTVVMSNVDQQLVSLLETYWASVADPNWQVKIWAVDATQPDETPLADGDVYEVVQAVTNLVSTTFALRWQGMTLTKRMPGRRYTRSGGFPDIPRRRK